MFEQNRYFIFHPVRSSDAKAMEDRPEVASPSKLEEQSREGLQTQLAQAKESFLRASADFENYKRRMQKEQAQWLDVGATRVLAQLLPIVDDFERGLAAGNIDDGFLLIYKSLQKLLESFDVKEISADIPFDPEMHEALVSVEDSGKQSGDVVEILQKGYLFKGKVLRPAKVSVAK